MRRPADATASPTTTGHRARRPDIQGLRALAVIVVIADHLLHAPSGGFVGVDVFFVISGFLITGILLREYARTSTISFVAFYRRRVRRIIPVAVTVIVVTLVAGFVLLPSERAVSTAWDGLFAAGFAANWRFAIEGTDYFRLGLPPSPLQHYWSLSVEEQYYLFFPWLMLAALVLAARVGWSATARGRLIVGFVVLITLASYGWSAYETSAHAEFAYFSTFSRAWELGVGATLAALSPMLSRRIPHRARVPMAYLGLAGILWAVVSIDAATPVPSPGAALPVLATALVIAAGTGAAPGGYDRALAPLTNRVSGYLGDISYSLYLWHFPVVVLLLAFFPDGSIAYVVTGLVLIAGLSVLSYHALELPVRRSSWLERRPARSTTHPSRPGSSRSRSRRRRRAPGTHPASIVAVVVVATVAVAVVATAVIRAQPVATIAVRATTTAGATASNAAPCFGADFMAEAHRPVCTTAMLRSTTAPSVDRLSQDVGTAYDCYRIESGAARSCHYGPTSATATRVALVGDSHAAMLLPALMPGLTDKDWSLDTYLGFGCQWKQPYSGDCDQVLATMIDQLTSGHYDMIITTGARWVGGDPQQASEAYAAAWQPLVKKGVQVVVVGDVPEVSDDALACISRFGFKVASNSCGTSESVATAKTDPLVEAAKSSPDVHFVDLTDYFCRDGFCPSVIGGVIVYRDAASHVTNTYMTSLSPYLLKRITT